MIQEPSAVPIFRTHFAAGARVDAAFEAKQVAFLSPLRVAVAEVEQERTEPE